MINETISSIIATTLTSFDFPFCVAVNIATYLIIKTIGDTKCKGKITTWHKRGVFLAVSILIAIIYYHTGSDIKTLANSIILAPVSWSWIFKPICKKLKVDYNTTCDNN